MTSQALLAKSNYRPDEVAVVMKLSKRTVYRMIHDGRLTGFRKAGSTSIRIPREAVLNMLKQNNA